jgi:hypothetical protein
LLCVTWITWSHLVGLWQRQHTTADVLHHDSGSRNKMHTQTPLRPTPEDWRTSQQDLPPKNSTISPQQTLGTNPLMYGTLGDICQKS